MMALDRATECGGEVLTRAQFLDGLRAALVGGTGYATGKLGFSETHRMEYAMYAARPDCSPALLRRMRPALIFHCLTQHALFPPDPEFYLRFTAFYAERMRELDCLGVFDELLARTRRVAEFYRLDLPLVHFLHQEPDRSVPADEASCYLPAFRGKRVLIVCSFAELLRQRATRETFEGVWANTGKPWFDPASVDALEFPYGYSAATHARYPTSLDLYAEVAAEMGRRDFDVALIGAAGLGIPLAAHAKKLGKVGISLGGHLQVVFGVLGKRWRDDPEFMGRYVNDRWIDMPARYRPPERDLVDGGAYW